MKTAVNIRWMIRRDMAEVLEIERASFEQPWPAGDKTGSDPAPKPSFVWALRQRNQMGMVAERNGQVVGYVIYQLRRTMLEIVRMAVRPERHRQGIGRAIIAKLKRKITAPGPRRRIVAFVGERLLPMQLLLKGEAFRAVTMVLDYEDIGSDEQSIEFVFPPYPPEQPDSLRKEQAEPIHA